MSAPKSNGSSNGSSNESSGNGTAKNATSATTPKLTLKGRLWAPGTSTPIPEYLSLAALRIALTAGGLGLLAGLALPKASTFLINLIQGDQRATPIHVYLLAWSTFHFLEFVITAKYNATRLYADSFLISNGVTYHLAHCLGLLEYSIDASFFPQFAVVSWHTFLGLAMVLFGQTLRSFAMINAAGNFSHEVATRKRDDHQLVTDGVYSICRHPSYAGFFYWALGTQIMLGNPFSFFVFLVILWRFFSSRIKGEELHLQYFFGQAYKDYRARTWTLIPFIP